MAAQENNRKDARGWEENSSLLSIDFDYDGIDVNPLFQGDFGICLRNAINSYMTGKLISLLAVFDSLSDEERKVLIAVKVDGKSFRRIHDEGIINRDKNIVKNRYFSALDKLGKSPLVKINVSPEKEE